MLLQGVKPLPLTTLPHSFPTLPPSFPLLLAFIPSRSFLPSLLLPCLPSTLPFLLSLRSLPPSFPLPFPLPALPPSLSLRSHLPSILLFLPSLLPSPSLSLPFPPEEYGFHCPDPPGSTSETRGALERVSEIYTLVRDFPCTRGYLAWCQVPWYFLCLRLSVCRS